MEALVRTDKAIIHIDDRLEAVMMTPSSARVKVCRVIGFHVSFGYVR
jgi:hypothetical protein